MCRSLDVKLTNVFTTLFREVPVPSTIDLKFVSAWSACSLISEPLMVIVSLSIGTQPEMKTRFPALIACEYGAFGMGASKLLI